VHYGIIGNGSVVRALLDCGIAQRVEHCGIAVYSSVGRAQWYTGKAQWLEHYMMVDCSSVDRALWDSGIAQRVEHCGIVVYSSVDRALWDSKIAQWLEH